MDRVFEIGYNQYIGYIETHFVLEKSDVTATTIPKNSIKLPKDAKKYS